MIQINLLPEEFRRTERTSPKLFGTVLLAVICVCCSIGWLGYVYFGELGRLEREHERVTEVLASKQDSMRYFEALSAEKKDFQLREKTIGDIGKSRVVWSRILDELFDTIDNDGDSDRHLAWFKSLSLKGGDGKKRGASMSMPGWVAGDELRALADFHDDIENVEFFGNVKTKSMPTGKRATNEDRRPSDSLYFTLGMEFLPAKKWKRDIEQTEAK